MARHRSDREPKIRVLEGLGDEPTAPTHRDGAAADAPPRSTAVLVGFISVLVGVVLGSSLVRNPEEPAPATGPAQTTTTTTRAPAPTTIPDPLTLGEMVPGFTGALQWVPWTTGDGLVATWELDQTTFGLADLPFLARPEYAWDAAGNHLAALAVGVGGFDLYAGIGPDLGPIALDVSSFAWHGSTPGLLAWMSPTPDGAELTTLDFTQPGTSPRTRTTIDGELVAWGDWGFLLQRLEPGRSPTVVALGPDLEIRGEHEAIVNERINGVYSTIVATSLTPLDIVDPLTGELALPAGPVPAALEAYVNPTTRQVVTFEPAGGRTNTLWLRSLDGPTATPFDVPGNLILDWSPDGRWILLDSQRSVVTPNGVRRILVMVDTVAGTVAEVPYAGSRVVAATMRFGNGG